LKFIALVHLILFTTLPSIQSWAQTEPQEETKAKVIRPTEKLSQGEPAHQSRQLSLKDTIEEGLRNNQESKERDYQKAKLEIGFKRNFHAFWYPQLKLSMNYGNQRIDSLKHLRNRGNTEESSTQTPQGYLGLGFDDYTVFNWGKDYQQYLNTKKTFEQDKEKLEVQRRQLRFALIAQYFNLVRVKEIMNIRSEQLRQASFIYRLAREKASLSKISKQEYLEARENFLKAQQYYNSAQDDIFEQESNLSTLIGSDNTKFVLIDVLRFRKVPVTNLEAKQKSLIGNEHIRNSKIELENAVRSYEIAKKENLPLPKFSINLGTYKKFLGKDHPGTGFETHDGNNDIELAASVNMTWDLFGSEGFFNEKKREESFINKRIAEIRLRSYKDRAQSKASSLVDNLISLERNYDVSLLRKENGKKSLDTTIDNYIAGKSPFINFSEQLENYSESQINLENVKFQHLVKKMELAETMGIEDFMGASFEDLGIKRTLL